MLLSLCPNWGLNSCPRQTWDLDSKVPGPVWTEVPMMWPEEFEMVAKTLARLRPKTYVQAMTST